MTYVTQIIYIIPLLLLSSRALMTKYVTQIIYIIPLLLLSSRTLMITILKKLAGTTTDITWKG
jgi:hypothetical protein